MSENRLSSALKVASTNQMGTPSTCGRRASGYTQRRTLVASIFSVLFFLNLNPRRAIAATNALQPNVILITLDTVRADHLACYGDREISTPNIDTLARVGVRFTRAFTAVPITLPSHTCIMTGSYPLATGMHDFSSNALSPKIPTLATVLRNHGYTTAAFIAAAVLAPRFGLNQGFDFYSGHFNFNRLDEANLDQVERPGNEVMDEVLAWLRTDPRQPIFLWVHLYDAHYPYHAPQPLASRYRMRPYDGGIAFDDEQVGRLLSYLREHLVFDRSIVAIMADHGESLGEHGEKTHGFFIYNSTLHVPLIIKAPGVAPRVVKDNISLVDVMPTLLQILKIPSPPTVQGRSLLGDMLGRREGAHSVLYSETYLPLLHFQWSPLRCLQNGETKYIDAPRPELYDLQSDPNELKNLAPTHRALALEMHNRLFDAIHRFTPTHGNAAAEKAMTDPALMDRLRSLGYTAISAGTVTEASGKPLPDPKDRIQVYELVDSAMADGQHGRYVESLSKLRTAVRMAPDCMAVHYLMALDEFRKGDFRAALAEFQTVLKLNPRDGLATYYYALTQVKLGDVQSAAASFQRALDLDPTNSFAAFNLGVADLGKKDVSGAIALFQRALQINPDYVEAHQALGEVYLYQSRIPDAVTELERAVTLEPSSRKAHYELGRAYQAAGRAADAQRQFALAREQ